MTFYPHPKSFFKIKKTSTITFRQRVILKQFGIRNLVFIRFNEKLSTLSANTFISKILSDNQMQIILLLIEFKFAKNRLVF